MDGRKGETRLAICGIRFEFIRGGEKVIRGSVGQGETLRDMRESVLEMGWGECVVVQ